MKAGDVVEICIGTKERGRFVVIRHENGTRSIWLGDQQLPPMKRIAVSLDYEDSAFVYEVDLGFHVCVPHAVNA